MIVSDTVSFVQPTEVRYVADSPDDLRTKATDARPGDIAKVQYQGREITMIAIDGGPFGLIWEEQRRADQ